MPLHRSVRPRRLLAALALAACLLVTPGCGAVRFCYAWSGREPPPADAAPIEGRWRGSWRSHWNGHSGGLRCIVTPEEEGVFRAWFYSTYARILFFQYRTLLAVSGDEDGLQRFEGQQDLGSMAGGVYRYRGHVKGDAFHATFRADNGDHGVFEMERVD